MNIQFVFLRIAPIYQITFERVPRALSQIVQTPTTWRFLFVLFTCFFFMYILQHFLCSRTQPWMKLLWTKTDFTRCSSTQCIISNNVCSVQYTLKKTQLTFSTFSPDWVYCFDEGHWQETDANGGFQGHQKLFSINSLNLDLEIWLRRYSIKT